MSILPITLIVIVLCFTIIPVSTDSMLAFLVGAFLLIAGLGLFSIGAENSLVPIGNATGTWLTKVQKLMIILPLSLILGTAVTIAEPDLQVLAANASWIDSRFLILSVAFGAGIFLVAAMLRIFFGVKLKWILLASYGIVFALAIFSDESFLGVAFDSGGVTTGPMTVPFIMALGIGAAALRNDKNATADSFGLLGLCSIGPIIAVLVLGFFYKGETMIPPDVFDTYKDTVDLSTSYLRSIPAYMVETAVSLSPVFAFFLFFQMIVMKLSRNSFLRILVGFTYTYVGVVFFLTGVNVGFAPLGNLIGQTLASDELRFLLIPVAMLLGWFTIAAEPAVGVLNKQVEGITGGAITGKAMGNSLSIGVAIAMALAMARILTGISILWFLIPGYFISLVLMFFVPDMFTSIAFDSGGVAAGTLAGAFMLPFAIGASTAVNGSAGGAMVSAFGLIAMVAMMPLITIQIMGAVYKFKLMKLEKADTHGGIEVIDLWKA